MSGFGTLRAVHRGALEAREVRSRIEECAHFRSEEREGSAAGGIWRRCRSRPILGRSMVCGGPATLPAGLPAGLTAWRFNLKWELALGRTAEQIAWRGDRQRDRQIVAESGNEGRSPMMNHEKSLNVTH